MKMVSSVLKCFGKEGLYLKKDISIHFSLRRGREAKDKLGKMDMDFHEDCNIAKKLLIMLLICLLMMPLLCHIKKKCKKEM